MNIKQGALRPNISITVTDAGSAVDLTSATSVHVVARREGATTPLFTRVATGDANGVVTCSWVAGETDTVGRINLEVLVTWPGAEPQRFPASSYLPVDIEPYLS